MNDDAMATSKLAEGIRGFAADIVKLEAIICERLGVSITPAMNGVATNGTVATAETEFDQLAGMTTIVADSGEIEAIRKFKPTDATTNPSLIYAAAQMVEYQSFVKDAVGKALAIEGGRLL